MLRGDEKKSAPFMLLLPALARLDQTMCIHWK